MDGLIADDSRAPIARYAGARLIELADAAPPSCPVAYVNFRDILAKLSPEAELVYGNLALQKVGARPAPAFSCIDSFVGFFRQDLNGRTPTSEMLQRWPVAATH